MTMARYLLVGHLTRDLYNGAFYYGGAVLYAGLLARRLGFEVRVITSSAEKGLDYLFPEISFYHFGARETTTFRNVSTPEGRRQWVYARARPLSLKDVPPSWRRAEIVHLAPVLDEIAPEEARFLETSFLVANPQGWFRAVTEDGRVVPKTPDFSSWPRFKALVLSAEDVVGLTDLTPLKEKAEYLVLTQGARGATLYFQGEEFFHPAYPVPRVKDTTGAGDIFAAAFFAMLYAAQKPLVALKFALCLAAFSVTRTTLAAVPTLEEITSCLEREEPRFREN